jgi:hypothetical protein
MVNLFRLFLATLTNQDGSEDKPSLVYDPAHNVLSFTHDVNRNPSSEHPVVRIFSLRCLTFSGSSQLLQYIFLSD